MNADEVEHLCAHPAWALLRSDHVAFVLAFLTRVFIDANVGDIAASALSAELEDELYAVRQRLGADAPARPAAEYLDKWSERGWLRKHYPPGSEEAHYDVTPSVEKALLWVRGLQPRDFVGTASRLNTIFDLLRQMVHGAETDPEHRLEELRRQRAKLDEEITRAEHGDIDVLDAVGQRDRYQQFSRTAQELLADFREVEENFRVLDRRLRTRIAGWTGSKGELLDDVMSSRSTIAESDQGRSFRAFFDFLLSPERREELTYLLGHLERIESIPDHDPRMARIHFDWIDACERTQARVRLLSEQLRRFLDDQVWIENRRICELLRNIETKAIELRELAAPDVGMEIDATRVSVVLPTERPLHRGGRSAPLSQSGPTEGGEEDFDSSILQTQIYIDQEELLERVLEAMGMTDQIGLEQVIEGQPLRHGLAELVGYLAIRDPAVEVVFDQDARARVAWTSDDDTDRVATLPRVTFSRDRLEEP